MLNENFNELRRKWANREDELCAIEEQLPAKDELIEKLKQGLRNVISQRNDHHKAAQEWKETVFKLSDRLMDSKNKDETMRGVSSNKEKGKFLFENNGSRIETLKLKKQLSFLEKLKNRCENLDFHDHISSLQPPDKFSGDQELFHTWETKLIDFFQNRQKIFKNLLTEV